MMQLRIKDLCKERGIKQPFTVLKKAGISVTKVIQYLDSSTNRLMLDDIETLCNLLHCTPNDLLRWTPKNKTEDYPANPLQALRHTETFNLEERLKKLTPKEIRERLGE